MQRANHVRTSPERPAKEREEKSPPVVAGGPFKQRIARRASTGADLVKSFRELRQVRDVVDVLRRIDDQIASGAAIERTDDLLRFYRTSWAIFDQLGCHAAKDRARRDFEALTGASWRWFTAALDAFGFVLLPPERRHVLYKMGGGVTRGDVEGWNDYPVTGGDDE